MTNISSTQKKFRIWFSEEFSPRALMPSLVSSILIYLLEVLVVISFAALLFASQPADLLPRALSVILIGNAVLVTLITVFSSYPGMIAVAQDTPGAVMGIVALSLVAAIPNGSQHYATLLMMIVFTTMMAGLLFLGLGVFKLGGLARFLPYSVLGGFLAGTGWLLTKGGIGVMTSAPAGMAWLEQQALIHWLPGALLGVLTLVLINRFKKPIILPIVLFLAVVVFYIFAAAQNTPLAQLQADGWLVGAVSSDNHAALPFSAGILSQVDWAALWRQVPNLLPAAIVSVIGLLLNAGGMELLTKKDIDLNRELLAAGIANLFAAPFGALVGYQTFSFSALNHSMTGGRRAVGFFTAALLALTIYLGAGFVSYVPKLVFGAVLVYLGAALLYEWIYQAWFKFEHVDFTIIASILVVIITSGFLNGIIVGLVLAVMMFVVSYSQVKVIQLAHTGREYQSRVARAPQERAVLNTHGDQAYILKLEGFVFFGTANSIFEQVRAHMKSDLASHVKYILLDFAKVSGLDSTGMLSFSRLVQLARDRGSVLVFTGLTGRAKSQILKEPDLNEGDTVRYMADLDHGLEWYENQIISQHPQTAQIPRSLSGQFKLLLKNDDGEKLLPYLQRRAYQPGEYLIRQGDAPDYVYFIESGQVTAQLEEPGKPPLRLETMGGGHIVGEIGFYLGVARTACAVCELPSVVYTLSAENLNRIETDDPEAASAFHRLNVLLMSERLTHNTRMVNMLER